jgi:putative oxidoreductase
MAHASLAERFAFGTPLEEDAEPHIGVVPRSTTMLVARVLISAIFLLSGIAKLTDPAGAIGHMERVGLPNANVLLYVAAFAEILGGLAVLSGFLARVGSLGLVVYLAITTLVFHRFWELQGQEMVMQNVQFMKNLAIMGGLLLLYAVGPGRYSIDARLRRPFSP